MQRLSPRFRPQPLWKICGETYSPNLQRFVWGRHAGAHLDGHQHGGRKPAETSVTEFCYKSVNLSDEKLKNVTIILYSNTRTVQIAEFPEISHLLNQHHSSLAYHENLHEYQFLTALIHHESNISGGSIVLKFVVQ